MLVDVVPKGKSCIMNISTCTVARICLPLVSIHSTNIIEQLLRARKQTGDSVMNVLLGKTVNEEIHIKYDAG